jgi:hypothetical protein
MLDKKGIILGGSGVQISIAKPVDIKKIKKPNEQVKIAIESETIRIVNLLPQWIPGEIQGKRVSVWYMLPITYKLE